MLTVSSCLEEVGEFPPPDPVRSFHQALPALSCRLVLSSHGQELLGLTAHGQCCDAEQIHAPLATPKKLGNSSSGPKYSAGSRGFANRNPQFPVSPASTMPSWDFSYRPKAFRYSGASPFARKDLLLPDLPSGTTSYLCLGAAWVLGADAAFG